MTRARILGCLGAVVLSACGPSGPALLEFVDIQPPQPRIGETATLSFRAIDSRGEPAAGQTVKFKLLAEKPGVTLSPLVSSTQKGTGVVTTQLVVTGQVTSVTVVADADGKLAYSPAISFANTGVPNAKQFTFQCGPFGGPGTGGVHALIAWDAARHLVAGTTVDCWAHVGDRNSDGVPGASVSFLTEAGTITPTASTDTELIGEALAIHKITFPLPRDTDPGAFTWNPANSDTQTGEFIVPLWMYPWLWQPNPVLNLAMTPNLQEPRRKDPVRKSVPQPTNNPRDNLVTMIAITAGEEGFVDINGNGVFDNGEPFDDLTEPFVDSNDDGTWDNTERFVDVNGDGTWNGKNGVWDANTLIWKQEKITWTAIPNPLDVVDTVAPIFAPAVIVPSRACGPVPQRVSADGGVLPAEPQACPTCIPCIDYLGGVEAHLVMSDPWFNGVAQNSDSDGCSLIKPEEKSPVTTIPSKANMGRLTGYPAAQGINFVITDSRDPSAPPAAQVPYRNPPIEWIAPIRCDFTSAPNNGYTVEVFLGTLSGYVQ